MSKGLVTTTLSQNGGFAMVNDQLLLESVNQARYDVRGLIEAIKNNKIMTSGEVTWESFGVLQHVRKSLIDAIKVSEGDQVNLEQLISENQPKPKKSYYKPRKKVEAPKGKVEAPKTK
jgi:hypothetical protein|nr:MAG TPA: hypothetical protein [Bacteriophage sp.]